MVEVAGLGAEREFIVRTRVQSACGELGLVHKVPEHWRQVCWSGSQPREAESIRLTTRALPRRGPHRTPRVLRLLPATGAGLHPPPPITGTGPCVCIFMGFPFDVKDIRCLKTADPCCRLTVPCVGAGRHWLANTLTCPHRAMGKTGMRLPQDQPRAQPLRPRTALERPGPR